MIDQASYSFWHAQKTHILIKIDLKCRTLFGKLRKHKCQVGVSLSRGIDKLNSKEETVPPDKSASGN